MSAPMIDDDAAVVQRFRATSGIARDAAFEDIFRSHRGRVYALCLRLAGSRALAEDALQETFLDVYRGLEAFRGDSRLSTWIYRLALRTALRLRARHRDLPSDDDAPTASIDPAGALTARDRVRRLEVAVAALPAEQRTVLCLFAVEGLGHREIADILGVPEGTVWSRLHQARKALAAVDG